MYYICKQLDNNTYGIMDTSDGVVEYFTVDKINDIVFKKRIPVQGVSRNGSGITIKVVKPKKLLKDTSFEDYLTKGLYLFEEIARLFGNYMYCYISCDSYKLELRSNRLCVIKGSSVKPVSKKVIDAIYENPDNCTIIINKSGVGESFRGSIKLNKSDIGNNLYKISWGIDTFGMLKRYKKLMSLNNKSLSYEEIVNILNKA